MKYLLDTNICIYLIRKKPPRVLKKFETYAVGDIAISSISVAELQLGVYKSQQPAKNKRALEKFLLSLHTVYFDYEAAAVYGEVRAGLEAQGRPIGALDMLIAAHALSLDLTLVTNNTKEFFRIPDLKVVNWAGKT